jgi:hypothetical protein
MTAEPRDLGSPVTFFGNGTPTPGQMVDFSPMTGAATPLDPSIPDPDETDLEAIAASGLDDPEQLALIGPDLEVVVDEIKAADAAIESAGGTSEDDTKGKVPPA